MDLKTFTSAIAEIAEERGVPKEKIIEVVEMALASAYKKEYGKKRQKIVANLNPKTGALKFWQVKTVVDKDMILVEGEKALPEEKRVRFNPERHIMLQEAKKAKKE